MKLLLVGVSLFLLPLSGVAQTSYTLLAPIATLSTVTLSSYLQGMVQVIIGVAGILAVVMIVICGIKLIGSPSVSQKSESKECIFNAIFGVLLAIGSWLILNTINTQLLQSELILGDLPVVGTTTRLPRVAPVPTAEGCYFKYRDLLTGDVSYARQNTCPTCENMRVQFMGNPESITVESSCFAVGSVQGPTAPTPVAPPPSSVPGEARCPQSGLNLHAPQFRQCTNAYCAELRPLAQGKVVSAELLMAIVMQESSCGVNLVGDGGSACGPTQLQTSVANMYRDKCGLDVNVPIQCGWLQEKANWDKAMCLTANYLKDLATPCGSATENVAAGYNGGPSGACGPSANCPGLKRWECLYDDNAHQICNNGYNVTRNYGTQVLYCTQNPG